MAGIAVDNLLHAATRRQASEQSPSDCLARFIVTKHSWRGRYRRVLCITPHALYTQHPENLQVTNVWSFTEDSDVEGITVTTEGDAGMGQEIILSCRKDKKSKYKPVKLACKHRPVFLTLLYQLLHMAAQRNQAPLAGKISGGTPTEFPAFKLRRGKWVDVVLRVTAWGLERLDPTSGVIKWRVEYRSMSAPALLQLPASEGDPGPTLAVFGKLGRSPRVFAVKDREKLVRCIQATASARLGVHVSVDSQGQLAGQQLLDAMAAAEREIAGTPEYSPLGEWEVQRVTPNYTTILPFQGLLTASDIDGKGPDAVLQQRTKRRRLVLTRGALLERRLTTYEVAERRQLGAVSALIRFVNEPEWLGVEWSDGSPATLYVTPAREAMMTAILDATQRCAHRLIAVIPEPTCPGDVTLDNLPQPCLACPVQLDTELERMCMHHIAVACANMDVPMGASEGGVPVATVEEAVVQPLHAVVAATEADVAEVSGVSASSDTSSVTGLPGASQSAVGTDALASTHEVDTGTAVSDTNSVTQATMNRTVMKLSVGMGGNSDPRRSTPTNAAYRALFERIQQLNACIPYTGVSPTTLMEDEHVRTLLHLLPTTLSANKHRTTEENVEQIAVLQCLQRLCSSPHITGALLTVPGWASHVFAALQSGHDHIALEAARLLTRLWAPSFARTGVAPWQAVRGLTLSEEDPATLSTAEENSLVRAAKATTLSQGGRVHTLVDTMKPSRMLSPLMSMALVEAIAACCCEPCTRTTGAATRQAMLTAVAALGRPLFGLFSHPAGTVTETAALIMRTIAQDGAAAAAPMREGALSEGALLQHMLAALSGKGAKAQLSRELVSMWADEYSPALNLLRRIFPAGLIRYLNQTKPEHKRPILHADAPGVAVANAARNSAVHVQLPNGVATAQAHEAVVPQLPVSRSAAGPLSPTPSQAVIHQEQVNGAAQQHVKFSTAADTAPTASLLTSSAAAGVSRPATPEGQAAVSSSASEATAVAAAAVNPPVSTAASAVPSAASDGALASWGRLKGNWDAFWEACMRDHCHAGLIWNERTRAELREALQLEDQGLRLGRMKVADGSGGRPSWNHWEFTVRYPSLARTLCVGGVYLKLLLEGADKGAIEKLAVPREFFHSCYHRFLCLADSALQQSLPEGVPATNSGSPAGYAVYIEEDPDTDRELCGRAMAAVYSVHAGTIGSFEGIAHVSRLLDLSSSTSMRHCMLQLLEKLLLPAAAVTDPRAERAAKANGQALVEAAGVQLLVDVLAAAHEATERTPLNTPLQTNLLSFTANSAEAKEWYYYTSNNAHAQVSTSESSSNADSHDADTRVKGSGDGRMGPITRVELKQLYSKGRITGSTLVWAEPMLSPQPLVWLRELRWMVGSRQGGLRGFKAPALALRMLQQLAGMQSAVDPNGEVLQPLPRAHREMISPACLPHVVQLLLTNEPELVSGSALLLETILAHNAPAAARLYDTGFYFFTLSYCGSNLTEIATLFHTTHLLQHWQGPQQLSSGASLAQRSILGTLLPESLLYVLQTHGPAALAAALVADSDTPELIWTHEMRAHLISQMLRHLGDFPSKLRQHNHAVYAYTPCPPIEYQQLTEELWCHRYYLRNLCNEERFPNWEIVDHVPLLQSLLESWRAELSRKPLSMTEVEACHVLEVKQDADGKVSEEELKAAYRKQARRYHPDKNPQGRDKFLAIQKAYQRLQAGAAGGQGPQPWRILLLLKSQCILYRRYPTVLAPFKYAGYPLLLTAISQIMGPSDTSTDIGATPPQPDGQTKTHFLSPENSPQLIASVELCSLTCAASPLNGEELTRSGGLRTLGTLLQRCAAIIAEDCVQHAPEALLLTHAMGALAGMAAFDIGRAEFLIRESLVRDVVCCCRLQRAPAAVDAALSCIINMARSADLQSLMLRKGVLGYVVPLMFKFDVTHSNQEDAGELQVLELQSEQGPGYLLRGLERGNQQEAHNCHAMLAARALAALTGCLPPPLDTPKLTEVISTVSSLLTEALMPRLGQLDPRPLLKDLNSSVLTPQAIWNSSMRDELLSAMAEQRNVPDVGKAKAFRYKALAGELVVSGVFVRVYNLEVSFPVSDPAAFCRGLVTYLHNVVRPPPSADTTAVQWLPRPPESSPGGEAVPYREGTIRPAYLVQREHLLAAITALCKLLEAVPKVAKLLTTKQTLAPLLNCLEPTVARQHNVAEAAASCLNGDDATVAFEAEVAAGALAALIRLAQLSACVDAMAEERCVLLVFLLVHRPPTHTCLVLALRLLHALAPTPAGAWGAGCHAGALYLMTQLLPAAGKTVPGCSDKESQDKIRVACASLLNRLMAQALHGPRVRLLLSHMLPEGLVAALADGPAETAAAAFLENAETPETLWTRDMAATTAEELDSLAAAARLQQAAGQKEWSLPEGYRLPYQHDTGGQGELFVGGCYVRIFLRNPQFPLRDPKAFLEGLLSTYLSIANQEAISNEDADQAVVIAAATTALMKVHPLLAEHTINLGYADKLVKLLTARVPLPAAAAPAPADDLGGTCLRLLHQLAVSPASTAVFSRTATPFLSALLSARKWGIAGSVLSLETIKRALEQGDSKAELLVAAAVQLGVVEMLLGVLEWQSGGEGQGAAHEADRDEAVERVLAVDVLHLLSNSDVGGIYASKVQGQLAGSSVWQAYSNQKHDLFLPAGDISQGGGVVALLKGSNVERFALPAAPSQQ